MKFHVIKSKKTVSENTWDPVPCPKPFAISKCLWYHLKKKYEKKRSHENCAYVRYYALLNKKGGVWSGSDFANIWFTHPLTPNPEWYNNYRSTSSVGCERHPKLPPFSFLSGVFRAWKWSAIHGRARIQLGDDRWPTGQFDRSKILLLLRRLRLAIAGGRVIPWVVRVKGRIGLDLGFAQIIVDISAAAVWVGLLVGWVNMAEGWRWPWVQRGGIWVCGSAEVRRRRMILARGSALLFVGFLVCQRSRGGHTGWHIGRGQSWLHPRTTAGLHDSRLATV